jgi:hypothetical protein
VGLPVAADASYVVQVHYNLANPAHIGSLDQTTIELKTEIEVDRIGWNILHDPLLEDAVYGGGEVLPPGDPAYKYTWSMSGASMLRMGDQSPYEADMQLHGVFPHMHEYGTAMGMDLIRADGSRSCAVEVPRWDFGWQRLYFYEEPLSISPADLVEISCTYDTTAATEPITPGWGTDNEMCLMGMIASVPAR